MTSLPLKLQPNFVPNSFSHFNTILCLALLSFPGLLQEAILKQTFKQSTFKCNQIDSFLAILYE